MVKKRKDDVEIDEVMKLTKVAKSWEFTCSFCFKKFPSAQAMGGHQNAHRKERLEEKRLFVRDPISHRKRAFLRAIKADAIEAGSTSFEHLHAPAKMVKPKNVGTVPPSVLGGDIDCFYQRSSCNDSSVGNFNGNENLVMINFLPPKEIKSTVGDHAESHKGDNPCTRFNLDLTLKL